MSIKEGDKVRLLIDAIIQNNKRVPIGSVCKVLELDHIGAHLLRVRAVFAIDDRQWFYVLRSQVEPLEHS